MIAIINTSAPPQLAPTAIGHQVDADLSAANCFVVELVGVVAVVTAAFSQVPLMHIPDVMPILHAVPS